MDFYKVIIEFRRDYYRLHYFRSDMNIEDLSQWASRWGEERGYHNFDVRYWLKQYAVALADTELSTRCLLRYLKKSK